MLYWPVRTSLGQIGQPLASWFHCQPRHYGTPLGKQIMRRKVTSIKSSSINAGSGAMSLGLFPLTAHSSQSKQLTYSHLLKWNPFFFKCHLNTMVNHNRLHLSFHDYCLCKTTTKVKADSAVAPCLLGGNKHNHAEWSHFKFIPTIFKDAFTCFQVILLSSPCRRTLPPSQMALDTRPLRPSCCVPLPLLMISFPPSAAKLE